MADYSMKDIRFVYKTENGEIKESVHPFIKCWFNGVITEQTICENLKYFINFVFSIKRNPITEEFVCNQESNFYSSSYTKRYLRYIIKNYPNIIKYKRLYGIGRKIEYQYYVPYEIIKISLTDSMINTESMCTIFPTDLKDFSEEINNTVSNEKQIKDTEYIIELALHLIKEFEGKRKEKLISCDEWVYLKQAVKNYYEEEV
jgi:hypothetical protein